MPRIFRRISENREPLLTPLRPSGTARIGGKRVDVVTVGDFIAQNSSVKVVEVEGPKVFVEAVEDD